MLPLGIFLEELCFSSNVILTANVYQTNVGNGLKYFGKAKFCVI